MIPRTIHYCWFGENPLPESVKKYIESWKRESSQYTIVEWNEKNYDIAKSCDFVKKAYLSRKWAFVSDYVRLDVIYRYGGIYLDTDVELIQSLDGLIQDGKGFMGYENNKQVNTGLGFAAAKGDKIIREMMNYYEKIEFDETKLDSIKCPLINTLILSRHGLKGNNTLQIIENLKILPTDYLCPENIYTGKKSYAENTYSIHHYAASWMDDEERRNMEIYIKKKKEYGKTIGMILGYIMTFSSRVKLYGLRKAIIPKG